MCQLCHVTVRNKRQIDSKQLNDCVYLHLLTIKLPIIVNTLNLYSVDQNSSENKGRLTARGATIGEFARMDVW